MPITLLHGQLRLLSFDFFIIGKVRSPGKMTTNELFLVILWLIRSPFPVLDLFIFLGDIVILFA